MAAEPIKKSIIQMDRGTKDFFIQRTYQEEITRDNNIKLAFEH
ncbi:hypothetical protein SDC9_105814 [bioreactor metagenome]|uniref:Uncharacterized protein n=1 Tax=bioreactor metagenome TaxID=1076179 RepID=A0A645B1Q3_9ZZZZ